MLVTMKELLRTAEQENKAVGSFSTPSMEVVMGAVKAAEESNTPIIIQIAEGRLKNSPLHMIGSMMVQAARESNVPICVHLDHGLTLGNVRKALDLGFSSIMFDGSRYPFEENVRCTNEAAKLARAAGASVEAELGVVGGKEATENTEMSESSKIQQLCEFYERVDIDALAPSIGNAHGHYVGEPHLNFTLLKEAHEAIPCPLVLHGGSGLSDEVFRKCIENGIRKINIMTSLLDALLDSSRRYLTGEGEQTYFELNERVTEAVYNTVRHYIKVFNNKEAL